MWIDQETREHLGKHTGVNVKNGKGRGVTQVQCLESGNGLQPDQTGDVSN